MNAYLFMATHLPELAHCLARLAECADDPEPVQVWLPANLWGPPASPESPFAEAAPSPLRECQRLQLRLYDPLADQWRLDPATGLTHFIVLSPRSPLIPQLEALASAFQEARIEPVKVVTCVDTEAAQAHAPLRTWLEACIYYSDIVLLGNRTDQTKAFLRQFQKSFERQCYPCRFLLLKGPGHPDRPMEILAPFTQRLSQLFDLPEPEAPPLPGLILEASCDLDLEEPVRDPYRPSPEDAEAESPPPLPDISPWIVT